jgi:hypothetical protein
MLSRASVPGSISRPVQRDVIARPTRHVRGGVPVQATIPADPRPTRAFGASAIHDEATLDIPAYIRRSRP